MSRTARIKPEDIEAVLNVLVKNGYIIAGATVLPNRVEYTTLAGIGVKDDAPGLKKWPAE